MEVLFPGSAHVERGFELRFMEVADRVPTRLGPALTLTAYAVDHASGAPAHGLRLACDGKVIAYSGDPAWTETLVALANEADLFICESYVYDRAVRYHLSYATLAQQRHRLRCRRLILTHPGADMLQHRSEIDVEIAEDAER